MESDDSLSVMHCNYSVGYACVFTAAIHPLLPNNCSQSRASRSQHSSPQVTKPLSSLHLCVVFTYSPIARLMSQPPRYKDFSSGEFAARGAGGCKYVLRESVLLLGLYCTGKSVEGKKCLWSVLTGSCCDLLHKAHKACTRQWCSLSLSSFLSFFFFLSFTQSLLSPSLLH